MGLMPPLFLLILKGCTVTVDFYHLRKKPSGDCQEGLASLAAKGSALVPCTFPLMEMRSPEKRGHQTALTPGSLMVWHLVKMDHTWIRDQNYNDSEEGQGWVGSLGSR